MRVFLVCLFLLASSQNLLATGYSDELTVESVSAYGDGGIVLVQTSRENNGSGVYTAGCVPHTWIIKAATEAGLNRIYSALMTAVVSGKTVNIYYSDTCGSWNYHHGSVVRLNK